MALTFECASRTDTGRRADNEDSLLTSRRLLAVADGVGGSAAGEVASRWIIEALNQLDKSRLTAELDVALADAIAWGNQAIGFLAQCREHLAGMSTTLTAIALDDGLYLIANIGDSRAYRLRDARLTRLTRDDSFIQDLLDSGHLTPAQARVHPARSLVLRALDGDPARAPSLRRVGAREGDRLLVCSDGLSDVVDDAAITTALRADDDPQACADALVDAALERGSRDNVTVVVADVAARVDAEPLWPPALMATG